MQVETIPVGDHWAHKRLAKSLLAVSHARELLGALVEWVLVRVDRVLREQALTCDCCGRKIQHYCVLENRVNGHRLVVGRNCYGKLLRSLKAGRIESPLESVTSFKRGMRAYFARAFMDASAFGWFREQQEAGTLPQEIGLSITRLDQLGFVPSREEADMLIAFYWSTRLFPLEVLLTSSEQVALRSFTHRRLLPRFVPLAALPRIRKLIELDQILVIMSKIRAQRKLDVRAKKFVESELRKVSRELLAIWASTPKTDASSRRQIRELARELRDARNELLRKDLGNPQQAVFVLSVHAARRELQHLQHQLS